MIGTRRCPLCKRPVEVSPDPADPGRTSYLCAAGCNRYMGTRYDDGRLAERLTSEFPFRALTLGLIAWEDQT